MIRDTPEDVLFPALEPYDQGMLAVGDGHCIHYEQCGNPQGIPALFLHGGPGSGCMSQHRRFFDPAEYRIVLFDQRGCGRSTPRGSIHHNDTAHLLADIERLRLHLAIAGWLVFGGSWGSSLALAYAAEYTQRCLGLILRGIFLTGKSDLEWFFQQSAQLLPEEWAQFSAVAPRQQRGHLLRYCEQTIHGAEPERARASVLAWSRYEDAVLRFGSAVPAPPAVPPEAELPRLLDKYRIQSYYLSRQCFLGEARLLHLASRCDTLPTAIVHGRLDLVCRPANAWRLHRAISGSRLRMIERGGHSPFDAELAAALLAAGDCFVRHGDFHAWSDRP